MEHEVRQREEENHKAYVSLAREGRAEYRRPTVCSGAVWASLCRTHIDDAPHSEPQSHPEKKENEFQESHTTEPDRWGCTWLHQPRQMALNKSLQSTHTPPLILKVGTIVSSWWVEVDV